MDVITLGLAAVALANTYAREIRAQMNVLEVQQRMVIWTMVPLARTG